MNMNCSVIRHKEPNMQARRNNTSSWTLGSLILVAAFAMYMTTDAFVFVFGEADFFPPDATGHACKGTQGS